MTLTLASMTRTVALLGATGYTGRLTAAELERKGLAHRVGERRWQLRELDQRVGAPGARGARRQAA